MLFFEGFIVLCLIFVSFCADFCAVAGGCHFAACQFLLVTGEVVLWFSWRVTRIDGGLSTLPTRFAHFRYKKA